MAVNLNKVFGPEVHHGIASTGIAIGIYEYTGNISPLIPELRTGNPKIEVDIPKVTGNLRLNYVNIVIRLIM